MTRNITVNTVAKRTAIQTHIIYVVNGAGGDDTADNLIELCSNCHRKAHDGIIKKEELLKIVKRRKRK